MITMYTIWKTLLGNQNVAEKKETPTHEKCIENMLTNKYINWIEHTLTQMAYMHVWHDENETKME